MSPTTLRNADEDEVDEQFQPGDAGAGNDREDPSRAAQRREGTHRQSLQRGAGDPVLFRRVGADPGRELRNDVN